MLSFLQKMIAHLLQIRVLQIRVLQIHVLQIQSVFYKSSPVHILQYAVTLLGNSHGGVNKSLSLSRNKKIKSKLFNEINQKLGMLYETNS